MGIKSQSNGGNTLLSTMLGLAESMNEVGDGAAFSGFTRIQTDSHESAVVGRLACDKDGQPLSQDQLAREVERTNEMLQDFGDDWAEQLEIVEADLKSVTRQCIAENYPAAREGMER